MNVSILTKEDLWDFKMELIEELRKMVKPRTEHQEWMKAKEVRKILSCSAGTLQNLRVNGKLPFTKVGGSIYYSREDVQTILESNKLNAFQ